MIKFRMEFVGEGFHKPPDDGDLLREVHDFH